MMKITSAILGLLLTLTPLAAAAELEPWVDYDIGDRIYSMTTIKVDSNMQDVYLEGLKQTWVASNEVAKKLGQIADYHIYRSTQTESGDFNVLLVVEYASAADLEPSRERYEAFMKEWGEANEEQNRKIAETYPDVRNITGEYQMREITLK